MTTTMAQRVAKRHFATSSAREEVMWASQEIAKANDQLENVYLALTARGHSGPPYEGFESLADGDSVISAAVDRLQDASVLLEKASKALRDRSSSMPRIARAENNILNGMDKRTGLRRINAVIAGAHLNGIFRDDNWTPIQRLWREFDKANIPANLTGTFYTKDDQGNPNSKTWKFAVEWIGPNEQPVIVHGQVIASGAGSVKEPLDAYDVVAYAG